MGETAQVYVALKCEVHCICLVSVVKSNDFLCDGCLYNYSFL